MLYWLKFTCCAVHTYISTFPLVKRARSEKKLKIEDVVAYLEMWWLILRKVVAHFRRSAVAHLRRSCGSLGIYDGSLVAHHTSEAHRSPVQIRHLP